MKNLILLQEKIGGVDGLNGAAITHVCLDSPSQVVYALSTALTLVVYHAPSNKVLSRMALASKSKGAATAGGGGDDPDDPLLASSDVPLNMTYLNELEGVCIVAASGNVLLVHYQRGEVSNVCTLPARLSCAVWSPEQEICAITTIGGGATNQLVLLTKDWDVLYDVALQQHHATATAAAAAATATATATAVTDSKSSSGVSAGSADVCTALSWRGDGQFFVTNCWTPATATRCFRVWSREAVLQSASAPFPASTKSSDSGVSEIVCWKPSGQLIASSQRTITTAAATATADSKSVPAANAVTRTVRNEIIFYERNGLRHGDFALPDAFAASRVVSLAWSIDSEVLMVCLQLDASATAATGSYVIQFWSVNNYHWYLKQHFMLPPGVTVHAGAMSWDPEKALTFVAATANAQFRWLEWCWDVCVSSSQARRVSVIDSHSILCTPLWKMVVPPPMSESVLLCGQPIQNLSASSSGTGSLAALLSGSAAIRFFPPSKYDQLTVAAATASKPSAAATASIATASAPAAFTLSLNSSMFQPALGFVRQIEFIHDALFHSNSATASPAADRDSKSEDDSGSDTSAVLLIESTLNGTHDTIVEVWFRTRRRSTAAAAIDAKQPATPTTDDLEVVKVHRTPILRASNASGAASADPAVPVSVRRLYSRAAEKQYVAVLVSDGSVLKYTPAHRRGGDAPSLSTIGSFPSGGIQQFAVCEMGGVETIIGQDSARLYIDQTLISPQCSSFALHTAYLVFTVGGQQHAMFFLDLNRTLAQNVLPENRDDPHMVRYMERGASIVTVVPAIDRPRVIVQMPRGNLETVYPRALTLYSINHSLARRDYLRAFLTARVDRIDLNLLYDHNPSDFLSHTDEFVRQINSEEYINLFLSDLNNEDATKTKYPRYVALPPLVSAPVAAGGGADTKTANLAGIASTNALAAKLKEAERHPMDDRTEELPLPYAALDSALRTATAKNGVISDGKTKVNRVCDAVRGVLVKQASSRFTISVLTTHVKKEPQELESALLLIRSLRDRERPAAATATTTVAAPSGDVKRAAGTTGATGGSRERTAEVFGGALGALKYVIFLADVNRLYDIALGMYDFDLVMMVAQQSLKDPKEYLPFLAALQALAPTGTADRTAVYWQRYNIDMHLKRYESALTNLSLASAAAGGTAFATAADVKSAAPATVTAATPVGLAPAAPPAPAQYFRMCLDLIKQHKLYLLALRLFPAPYFGSATNSSAAASIALPLAAAGSASTATAPSVYLSYPPPQPSKTGTAGVATVHVRSYNQIVQEKHKQQKSPEQIDIAVKKWRAVMGLYGDYLLSQHLYAHAASVFHSSNDYAGALAAYKTGGLWRQCFSVARGELKYTPAALKKLAVEVADILRDKYQNLIDAARVLIEYCGDVETATGLLIAAEEWMECIRVCQQHERSDLIETSVVPELMSAYSQRVISLRVKTQKYAYAVYRLRVVRYNKLVNPRSKFHNIGNFDGKERDDDLQSIVSGSSAFLASNASSHASTASSNSSIFSVAAPSSGSTLFGGAGAANAGIDGGAAADDEEARKQIRRLRKAKKKLSTKKVKEGSPLEEDYLIKEIKRLTPDAEYQTRIKNFIHVLLTCGWIEHAHNIQLLFDNYLRVVRTEEATPMPNLDHTPAQLTSVTDEQRGLITKHWNWPTSSYETAAAVVPHCNESVPAADLAVWRTDFLSAEAIPDSCLPVAAVVPDAPTKRIKPTRKTVGGVSTDAKSASD